jgi:hypothetical protein
MTSIIAITLVMRYSIRVMINIRRDIIISGMANAGNNERNSGMHSRNKRLMAPPREKGLSSEHRTSIMHSIRLSTGRMNEYIIRNGMNFAMMLLIASSCPLSTSGVRSGFSMPGGSKKDIELNNPVRSSNGMLGNGIFKGGSWGAKCPPPGNPLLGIGGNVKLLELTVTQGIIYPYFYISSECAFLIIFNHISTIKKYSFAFDMNI